MLLKRIKNLIALSKYEPHTVGDALPEGTKIVQALVEKPKMAVIIKPKGQDPIESIING